MNKQMERLIKQKQYNSMKEILKILNEPYSITEHISISIMDFVILTTVLIIARILLTVIRKLVTRNLPLVDKRKFKVIFSYGNWLIYFLIMLITFHTLGVNVTGIFAASQLY